jgi:hypothetical protein
MKIGFTGTRKGMSVEQYTAVLKFVLSLNPNRQFYFHHGQCMGADQQFHDMIYYNTKSTIIVHPSIVKEYTFDIKFDSRIAILPEKPYSQRNKEIVRASELLIATPGQISQIMRSGTWATLRYAKSRQIKFKAFLPDGTQSQSKKKEREPIEGY